MSEKSVSYPSLTIPSITQWMNFHRLVLSYFRLVSRMIFNDDDFRPTPPPCLSLSLAHKTESVVGSHNVERLYSCYIVGRGRRVRFLGSNLLFEITQRMAEVTEEREKIAIRERGEERRENTTSHATVGESYTERFLRRYIQWTWIRVLCGYWTREWKRKKEKRNLPFSPSVFPFCYTSPSPRFLPTYSSEKILQTDSELLTALDWLVHFPSLVLFLSLPLSRRGRKDQVRKEEEKAVLSFYSVTLIRPPLTTSPSSEFRFSSLSSLVFIFIHRFLLMPSP